MNLTHCTICHKEHSDAMKQYLRRHLQEAVCSSLDCRKKDDVQTGRLCCEQAEYTACVCTRSYKCPIHGEFHIGTHH